MMTTRAAELDWQRKYFSVPPESIRVVETPYVARHFHEATRRLGAPEGADVLEIGAGEGRYTRALREHGFDVTANELSPVLADRLRTALPAERLHVSEGDAAALGASMPGRFRFVVGFFVLHHFAELADTLAGVRRAMTPGGVAVFIEPYGHNPLYALQVALTPHMRFAGEPALFQMHPRALRRAFLAAGFAAPEIEKYGHLPPALYNAPAGAAADRWLTRLGAPRSFLAITAAAL
ncbi:MAG: class I SAM-dependent methyltransferase [Deltaproteobacteria bacterium]|nr:class I SAM-dependent methyltransferase [Deltaproteobacteria bacterium]